MKIEEPVYDISVLVKNNYHIHTNFSECASSEMSPANIIARAEKNNLRIIALVNHHHCWTEGLAEYLDNLKKEVDAYKTDLKILVGAELSAYGIGKYADSEEFNRRIEYRLYSCNHYHLNFWEHPQDKSPRGYAEHSLAVLKDLILSGRADCIAHPFIGAYLANILDNPNSLTASISDNELGDILGLGRKNNVCWEINLGAFLDDPDFARRYWNIGREAGVVFRFGTDAHRLVDLDIVENESKIKDIIGS